MILSLSTCTFAGEFTRGPTSDRLRLLSTWIGSLSPTTGLMRFRTMSSRRSLLNALIMPLFYCVRTAPCYLSTVEEAWNSVVVARHRSVSPTRHEAAPNAKALKSWSAKCVGSVRLQLAIANEIVSRL